jgi:hypothetical protein
MPIAAIGVRINTPGFPESYFRAMTVDGRLHGKHSLTLVLGLRLLKTKAFEI